MSTVINKPNLDWPFPSESLKPSANNGYQPSLLPSPAPKSETPSPTLTVDQLHRFHVGHIKMRGKELKQLAKQSGVRVHIKKVAYKYEDRIFVHLFTPTDKINQGRDLVRNFYQKEPCRITSADYEYPDTYKTVFSIMV